jgi:hypothetical protein
MMREVNEKPHCESSAESRRRDLTCINHGSTSNLKRLAQAPGQKSAFISVEARIRVASTRSLILRPTDVEHVRAIQWLRSHGLDGRHIRSYERVISLLK